MVVHLKIIGSVLVLLAVMHVGFPRYFNWKNEFQSVSLINRQMMYVHAFFIALGIFLAGLLCIFSSKELVETTLGRRIVLGLGIFWMIRLIIQFVGYSSLLWKGKRFETIVHIVFSLLWAYFTLIFLSIYLT